jgi:hypothetical protein
MKNPKPLPMAIKLILQDLKCALNGWDADPNDKEDANYADITLRPSEVRRMWKAIEEYGI